MQFASVALLRMFGGKAWLRRLGTLLVLASVVYDGVSQVLLSFPSIGQWDIFRHGIQPGFIAEADLVMSAGVLAFTVAYLVTCGPRRETPGAPEDTALMARVLDWRVLALACLPLAVLTYGRAGIQQRLAGDRSGRGERDEPSGGVLRSPRCPDSARVPAAARVALVPASADGAVPAAGCGGRTVPSHQRRCRPDNAAGVLR